MTRGNMLPVYRARHSRIPIIDVTPVQTQVAASARRPGLAVHGRGGVIRRPCLAATHNVRSLDANRRPAGQVRQKPRPPEFPLEMAR